ncbi:hypothetical protein [Proteus hauseri]|uniref:hypothetical protein n=1 Tax=Proteus hauseri TaxID=183417 RepID=UPI0032DA8408
MKPIIAINGAELGLLSSNTYILEKIINMLEDGTVEDPRYPTLRYYAYNVLYPDIWDKYIFFHRSVRYKWGGEGEGGGATAFPIPDGKSQFGIMCADYNNIYVYRPILDVDRDLKTKVNIFNDDGKLFYSASKLPLRIKDVITNLSYDGIINNKPLPHISGHDGCMVMSQVTDVIELSFFSMGLGYAISNDGIITRSTFPSQFGGGDSYSNDQGCIVAYAPDALPRWK